MRKHKSSVSEAASYKEIGEFWDTTREVSFEVDIESEVTYYAIDKMLSEKIQAIAQKRGVTADTLINLWVQEKLHEQGVSQEDFFSYQFFKVFLPSPFPRRGGENWIFGAFVVELICCLGSGKKTDCEKGIDSYIPIADYLQLNLPQKGMALLWI